MVVRNFGVTVSCVVADTIMIQRGQPVAVNAASTTKDTILRFESTDRVQITDTTIYTFI